MNEQIKQLWEEAAKTTQSDSWEEQTKFMERFAELIVKECIKAYNDDGYQTEYEQDQKVLKHFGVEE
jgi:leucyl aminopeptidase (aminopeptidase T)